MMYDQFGPTPRTCFEFVQNNALLVKHKERQHKVLSSLSVKTLHDMVLRYCRNVRPTWVKFNSKYTKESEWCSRF